MLVFYGGLAYQTARVWRHIGRNPLIGLTRGATLERLEIGIDPEPGPLVRTGIYSALRHPVYTALSLAFFGIFLLAPNRMFAILWLGGTGLAVYQALREETVLETRLGETYRIYMRQTGRFFPKFKGKSHA